MLTLVPGMRPRSLLFITLLALCHLQMRAQALTNAVPPAVTDSNPAAEPAAALPDDPGEEMLPVAQPEPAAESGLPVELTADSQGWVSNVWTGSGRVEVHYNGYILRADKVVYNQTTTELEAEGNLQVMGGPNDVRIFADRGQMRLNQHTARYFNVHGSEGVRSEGRTAVYTTLNPLLFSGRVLIETGEGRYKLIDGKFTNCRLPRPDWQILARTITIEDGKASTVNSWFTFLGVPIVYLPYLRHPLDENGRESGLLIPIVSSGSSIRGYTFGAQVYWAINRSLDVTVGMDYYTKRGWAPNGDFRYKGACRPLWPGDNSCNDPLRSGEREYDHLAVRWNALLDRGVMLPVSPGSTTLVLTDQGGVDIQAQGRKQLSPETQIAGNVEFLSSYLYRLVFNDNFWQAVSSEVESSLSLTHAHKGYVLSGSMERFQSFAGTTSTSSESSIDGNQARILHLPSLRFDVLDRPLGSSMLYVGMGSSLGFLNRSEPGFHARNAGRFDFYPHLALPVSGGGWSLLAEAALRETTYTISQNPGTALSNGTPTISHDPLNRNDLEASVDLRPPAVERDFRLGSGNRELRHVIEPEISYRYVAGIGAQAQHVLLIDATDIATNTNELGYSLTQRFYLRPDNEKPCAPTSVSSTAQDCPAKPREWASWQIAQKFYIDPNFGGALISGQRNVFDATLDLTGIAFLTSPRNLSPVTSRLRFEAIHNLRVEWDFDYDAKAGELGSDNLFAGYSWGRTTVGLGRALLNAVDESGNAASTVKSQQLQPFLEIGKPNHKGFNLAANGGYDFTQGALQYAGAQAVYNWDCCGLSFGYRRFELGTVRNETEYLYSFTIANFGSIGDIRHTNTPFRDPALPPAY